MVYRVPVETDRNRVERELGKAYDKANDEGFVGSNAVAFHLGSALAIALLAIADALRKEGQ